MDSRHHCNDCPYWYVTQKKYPSGFYNITICGKYNKQLYYLAGEENRTPHPCDICSKELSYVPYIEFGGNEVQVMKYKIGQILTSTKDVVIEKALSEEKVTIPKGNKIIIGADKLAHHIKNGMIQPLAHDMEVEGYDSSGIAEYIYICLKAHLPIDDWMEDYDISKDDIVEEIEYALDEIGLC